MLRFVVRRLMLLVPILVGLSILVFLWIHALPGNPAIALLGERATPASVAQFRRQYGLDKPIYTQYVAWAKTTLKGDFGYSIQDRRKVTSDFFDRFPSTLELAVAAMLVAVFLGIPLGFIAAKHYGGWLDHSSLVVSLVGISTPVFFLAIILKYLFAIKLHWLPTVGRISVLIDTPHPTNFYVLDAIIQGDWTALWDVLKHLILPALALGSIPLAIIARITRAAVADGENEDYVRTPRAKGLAPRIVDRRHVLRNALLPISTIIGLQTGFLLSGAILTETVFDRPGVGTWLYTAITYRDYPVLEAGILFLSILFVLVNLLVDISYAIINPRIRYS